MEYRFLARLVWLVVLLGIGHATEDETSTAQTTDSATSTADGAQQEATEAGATVDSSGVTGDSSGATGGSSGATGGSSGVTGGSTATTTSAPTTTAAPTTCTVSQTMDEAYDRIGCNSDSEDDSCLVDIGASIVYRCKDGKTTDTGPQISAACGVGGVMSTVAEWPACRDAAVCEGSSGGGSGTDSGGGDNSDGAGTTGDAATTDSSRRRRSAEGETTTAATAAETTAADAEGTGSTSAAGSTGAGGSTGSGRGETTTTVEVTTTTAAPLGPPQPGTGLKLKEGSDYTEARPAVYQCVDSSHKMADSAPGIDPLTGYFQLFCDAEGKWSAPSSWPTCVPPDEDTTAAPNGPTVTIPAIPTTTTPKPLPPCQCLGDKVLRENKANTLKVLERCRYSKSRLMENGVVPERYRCGSRTPDNATLEWNSYCNCTGETGPTAKAKKAFWTTVVLKNQNERDRWETYEKKDGSNWLKDPKSKQFLDLKTSIEKAFDTAFVDTAAVLSAGFVKNVVFQFSKGPGCRDPLCATVATTTAAPTTTAAATTAAAAAGDGATATGSVGTGATGTGSTATGGTAATQDASQGSTTFGTTGAGTTTVAATTTVARRKREVTSTTTAQTTTTYNAPSHFVQFTMETQFVDDAAVKTKQDFETLVKPVLDTGKVGDFQLNAESVDANEGKQEINFPDMPTCSNVNLTDVLANVMPTMQHNKPVNMQTYKDYFNETAVNTNGTHDLLVMAGSEPWTNDTLELSVGQEIELTCKKDLEKPSRDWYDLDPFDGTVTSVCQPDGKYSVRATMLANCVTTCDSKNIPIPDKEAGLEYIGIKKAGSSRLTPKEKTDDLRLIWHNDRLVYKCKEEKFGIMGGIDRQLDMYSCQKTGEYNTPVGINVPDGVNPQPWPKCEPQRYMVINAVENMLHKYDQRLSNRYKIIKFQAEDAEKEIVNLSDHFTEVTIPAVAGMIVVIVIALLCSRNDSPICKICESKA